MELNNVLILIYVITSTIKYKNKVVIFQIVVELLKTKSGHITQLIRAGNDFHYSVIYKFIERSRWNALGVHQKFILAVIKLFDLRKATFIIDDTIIYRSRKKTTVKGTWLYDHSNKANKSRYVWGQNILLLAAVVTIGNREVTLPLVIHLLDYASLSKSNKITSSAKMISLVKHFLAKHHLPHEQLTVTFDSFFAKKRLVDATTDFNAVFQARRDSALFRVPHASTKVRRGRKKIYGKRISIPRRSDLTTRYRLVLYGKKQTVYLKEFICKARFLKGQTVKAVYCRLESSAKIKLYISTNTSLSALEILQIYEKRWKIEPLFNELKNIFSFKNIWMQTVSSYQKFLHLKLWAFIITQLAPHQNTGVIETFVTKYLPWRLKANASVTITNGITQLVLSEFLRLLSYSSFHTKVQNIISSKLFPEHFPYLNKYISVNSV